MKSQLFDIRREYKKGRLTPGNLNDNPFEQFDHWLNVFVFLRKEKYGRRKWLC